MRALARPAGAVAEFALPCLELSIAFALAHRRSLLVHLGGAAQLYAQVPAIH